MFFLRYWDYEYIATGFVDPSSDIKMRLLSRKPVDDINVHLKSLISNSCSRRSHLRSSTNAIRLIHGENDFIPGKFTAFYAVSRGKYPYMLVYPEVIFEGLFWIGTMVMGWFKWTGKGRNHFIQSE